jgi:hypothetical protein
MKGMRAGISGMATRLVRVGWGGVSGTRYMRRRVWRKFLERVVLATAVTFVIAVAPLPLWTPTWFLYWQVPATVFVLVVYIGKLLIDTILFPRK